MQTDEHRSGILQATAVNGVLAIAATLVIISGGIDLSVGTLMTFCRGHCRRAPYLHGHLPMVRRRRRRASPAGRIVRHWCPASLIAKLKIPPFIATLGMMLIYKGLSLAMSRRQADLLQRYAGLLPRSRTGSLIGSIIPALPIPNGGADPVPGGDRPRLSSWRAPCLGASRFALGSNEEALRLSGVNIDRWKIAVYALAGGVCGVAGMLIASRINSAQPAHRPGLRARCHRGRGHRRHIAQRRPRHDTRHHHRRVDHRACVDQRPCASCRLRRNGRSW